MKKISLFLLLSFAGTAAISQSFMHGAGLTLFVGTAKNGNAAINEGISYSPRFNFIEKENMSVSVGIPFTIGLSGSYNSTYSSYYGSSTTNTLGLVLNVPLIINLNMGCGSSKETKSRFGYFVGAGFGYHHGTFKENLLDLYGDEYENTMKVSTFGPAANAGVRFGVGRGTHNIEIRLSYMKGLDSTKANIFGLGAAFNF